LNLFPDPTFGLSADSELLLSNAIYFSEGNGGVPTVPEPASFVLLGTVSLFALGALRRKLAA
jgi:hypothetical protein